MTLNSKHYEVIQLLIERPFTGKTLQELAADLGVEDRTLRKWRSDPDFQAEYEKAVERWTKNLEEVQFASKRHRLMELERLFKITPDSYIEKVIHAKGKVYDPESKTYINVDALIIDTDGNVIRDEEGNPVSVVAVRRLNVDTKARILEQIRDEIEPRIFRAGMRDRDRDGNERVWVFEVGVPPGGNETGIPWGDANAPLPEVDGP